MRKIKPQFTANAMTVLERRYLWKNDYGKAVETPAQLFERVAIAVARAEKKDKARWAERFYGLMASRKFLPNSPTLMNAGKERGQLSACFVLPIEDDLAKIFETLKQAALIHQSGGGTGFSFSRIRPQGSLVRTSHGVASGPVSFMRIFDVATETIKQGGTRRGANMGVLRVDHPDIFEFVEAKRDQKSIINFNISVGATDEFMRAAREDARFFLKDPRKDPRISKKTRAVRARELFDRIVQMAWECGDPGMIFLDRINEANPTPKEGPIEATNPCGEQPLLPYESCNLGSMNLVEYLREGELAWDKLREDIHLATRFLDNVIDVNRFPIPESEKITRKNRKIGLGVMGFADLLLAMEIPYESNEALALGERVMAFLDAEAKRCSSVLARSRGAFPGWKGSLWQKRGLPPLRNATVSTVAPTGTISIIAGVSSGIEPIFSASFSHNVLSGERLVESRSSNGPAWSPASNVSVEGHIRMQAAFQRHSDSAVSKTINLPKASTPAEIAKAYFLAHELGCKGITVYRDQSRKEQVLVDEAPPACPDC